MKKNFYLAHPTNSRHKVREWERKMESKYPINLFNPFYDMDRDDVKDWDSGAQNPRVKPVKSLVEDDLKFIKIYKDGVIAILDENVGVGSLQEMVYAFLWGIDIYTVANDKYIKHPWVVYHSRRIFSSIEELEIFIKEDLI